MSEAGGSLRVQDAHNHLQDEWLLPHAEAIIAECRRSGVTALVVNGTCPADWHTVAALAAAFPEVRPAFGIHPWDARSAQGGWIDELRRRLDAHPHAGVGEIGIDRWILDGIRAGDPRIPPGGAPDSALQESVFLPQLALAAERNLPASLHCLDAWGRLLELLRASPLPARGFLLHAYSGPAELVQPFAKLGAYFSFNGRFLDPRRARKLEPFRSIPHDRLLIETDAPAMYPGVEYDCAPLPPAPDGTPVTHPASVARVLPALARLRGTAPEILALELERNFRTLFG